MQTKCLFDYELAEEQYKRFENELKLCRHRCEWLAVRMHRPNQKSVTNTQKNCDFELFPTFKWKRWCALILRNRAKQAYEIASHVFFHISTKMPPFIFTFTTQLHFAICQACLCFSGLSASCFFSQTNNDNWICYDTFFLFAWIKPFCCSYHETELCLSYSITY